MRIFIITGCVVFLLLSFGSLFFPFETTLEFYTINMGSYTKPYSYHIESSTMGSELFLPVVNTILLFVTALFVSFIDHKPLYGIFGACINMILIVFLYDQLMHPEMLTQAHYIIEPGYGLYALLIGNTGILFLAVASGLRNSELSGPIELLDSI